MYRLKRHPFQIEAFLRRSLVLTYSAPEEMLSPLVKPGLTLDTHEGSGFLAVAMVETEGLRPLGAPRWLGRSFFLTGYRIFVRYKTVAGKNLRGLQILRSDANRRVMVKLGSLFSHYAYRFVTARATLSGSTYSVSVDPGLEATAFLDDPTLPKGSIFSDVAGARRFAGPMPFTFAYEPETRSIVRVEGVRQEWHPQVVRVEVTRAPNFAEFGLDSNELSQASAFFLDEVPYRWKAGVVEQIPA